MTTTEAFTHTTTCSIYGSKSIVGYLNLAHNITIMVDNSIINTIVHTGGNLFLSNSTIYNDITSNITYPYLLYLTKCNLNNDTLILKKITQTGTGLYYISSNNIYDTINSSFTGTEMPTLSNALIT